jgi:hypothetical protein
MDIKLLAEYSVTKVLSQGQFKLKKTITINARKGFSPPPPFSSLVPNSAADIH